MSFFQNSSLDLLKDMSTEELIRKLLAAKKPEDIFTFGHYKKEFDIYLKMIHPDVCTLDEAQEATIKLTSLKKQFEKGETYTDDAGAIHFNGYFATFGGDKPLLELSLTNYQKLANLRTESSEHFKRYLPPNLTFVNDLLRIDFKERALPLQHLQLPQEHVNWILSRLLEFSAWLNQEGYCHAGINPDSIFVVPETHGIICTSFYHLTKVGNNLSTISAKHKHWYPAHLFTSKTATPDIDLELAKRLAIYLLGDKSGNGVLLKKTHNEEFIDFLIKHHSDPYDTYQVYRSLLKKLFGPAKFHPLEL